MSDKKTLRFLTEEIYKEDYKTDRQDFVLSPREFNMITEIFFAQVENESGMIEFLSEGCIRVESESYGVWTDYDNGMTLEELGLWIAILSEIHNVQKTGLKVELKMTY